MCLHLQYFATLSLDELLFSDALIYSKRKRRKKTNLPIEMPQTHKYKYTSHHKQFSLLISFNSFFNESFQPLTNSRVPVWISLRNELVITGNETRCDSLTEQQSFIVFHSQQHVGSLLDVHCKILVLKLNQLPK